ncbi:hypothetical protein CQ009_16400 [Pseudomonas sp. MYb2]|uniref:hypothetical protein n=1 Tax=Pseudomonas TaxID=286 RepID=UPI000CFF64B3|nr:hypothetical protein [Pseudomonas syringae]MCF5705595.1 hypothetical protein [Pseudomonas syringae]PRB48719.1 hypothetical protein CQ025_15045 [Pseudomonas sp. MYb3]PRC32853.1 hypothetical protein CQ009_16400 [Pseudomonas sp. MYb2]
MPFSTDADDIMYTYHIDYRFNGEPRTFLLELKEQQLAEHEAAMHLLELHLGDAENGLIMPTADSTAEEILEHAERVGITQITVVGKTN